MFQFEIKGLIKVDLIKDFIQENKLSQKDFAKKCKINVWNLRRVLSDSQNYRIEYLLKIAKGMKIKPCELFNY